MLAVLALNLYLMIIFTINIVIIICDFIYCMCFLIIVDPRPPVSLLVV